MTTNAPSSTPTPGPLRFDRDQLTPRPPAVSDVYALDQRMDDTRAAIFPPASRNPEDLMPIFDLTIDPDDVDGQATAEAIREPIAAAVSTIVPGAEDDDPNDVCSETRPTDVRGLAPAPSNDSDYGLRSHSIAALDWDDDRTIIDDKLPALVAEAESKRYNNNEE